MSAPAQAQVLDLLRAEGPPTPDEIAARLAARGSLTSKNPRQTIRGALNTNAWCVAMGDGRYRYLPTFINGATIQQPMEVVAPDKRLIAATVELIVLFWPAGRWHEPAAVPTLDLAGGPTVAIDHDDRFFGWLHTLRLPLALPAPFWDWWGGQQHAGADTLLARCEDGEAKRFAIRAVRRADLDGDAVSAGNNRLRAAVVHILKPQRHLRPDDLSRRLFAAGIYHPPIPPDPLRVALFDPPAPSSATTTTSPTGRRLPRRCAASSPRALSSSTRWKNRSCAGTSSAATTWTPTRRPI